jgi:hypothetical protein
MHRVYTPLPAFDATAGIVIMGPEKHEAGYWTGCPGVLREDSRTTWLTYRQRRPRGTQAERGWRCAVAISDDGLHFRDVWSVHKNDLGSSSMERFCLTQTADGKYRLYLSYVDPADSRWRIDSIEAQHPADFDIASRKPVLTAASTHTEGVKDPYVLQAGPVTYLFASFAAIRDGISSSAHATGDIYNVGATTHPTGLAVSTDAENFAWTGEVLEVGSGWDRYQARLNSVVPVTGGFIGFYDGSASHTENYEEHCGIAVSPDLRTWTRLSGAGPWIKGPYGSGSIRYVDALIADGQWWIYYEMTRADEAHELRLIRLPARNAASPVWHRI